MAFQMPAEASLTGLALRVRDRDAMLAFYRNLLRLAATSSDGDLSLTPDAAGFTLRLEVNPQAPPRPTRSLGLYHFALLLPTRPALAAILRRLLEAGWPVD
ncbi:MAG: glyoxalase, partial [Armatimonadetes bacterium]|nr:glyoxalase [Armatimonadota bacterium]